MVLLKICSLKFCDIWQYIYFYRILNNATFKMEVEQILCKLSKNEILGCIRSFMLPRKLQIKSKGGPVVRTLASHQCRSGSNPGAGMWVEFVVGSLPCCERFFSGYSGFPLSPKTNISKFQFDQESARRRTTPNHYLFLFLFYLFI